MSKPYNGWTNYETRLVRLNIDEIDGAEDFIRKQVAFLRSIDYTESEEETYMAGALKAYFMDVSETEIPGVHKVADTWTARQLENDVDWNMLAETYLAEAYLEGM